MAAASVTAAACIREAVAAARSYGRCPDPAAEAAVCIPEEAEAAACAPAAAVTDRRQDPDQDLSQGQTRDPDHIPDPDQTPDPDPIQDPGLIPDRDRTRDPGPTPDRFPVPDGADTGIITTIISGIPRGSADLSDF